VKWRDCDLSRRQRGQVGPRFVVVTVILSVDRETAAPRLALLLQLQLVAVDPLA
jgi:hypothetical protein